MSFSLLYHTAAPRRNALSVRRLLQDASAMLLPEKPFPAVFRGEGRKEHEAPDRLSRRMSACGSAAAARAGCGGDRRRTDARRGLDALTQRHAGRRAAFPRHAHAAYRRELDRTQRVFPGVEFLALTAVRADGESVNASYYTLVTGARSKESAFALHLAARFSRAGERLPDGRVDGAAGRRLRYRRGRKPRISHRGERERADRSERQRGGFRLRLFRFPRCAPCRCARGGSSAAVRLLPALL